MAILIRNILPADAEDISQLSHQLGYAMSPENTLFQIQAISSNADNVAYVALDGVKIIGWIHLFYTLRLESAPYCEIGGLVVDEHYRGKGIGKQLIAYATPWCRSKGVALIKVRSNEIRTAAHEFYLHANFRQVKTQKVFELEL